VGVLRREAVSIGLPSQIKILSNVVSFRVLQFMNSTMSIAVFMGMRIVDLKKHAVGESIVMIISLHLRHCIHRVSATYKIFADFN